jgi:hypothetical protein
MFANDLKSLSESYGYRYCLLALRGKIGMQWREVSLSEYGFISGILKQYGRVQSLSDEELKDIRMQLQNMKTYVYEVKRREETPGEIAIALDFVRMDVGV